MTDNTVPAAGRTFTLTDLVRILLERKWTVLLWTSPLLILTITFVLLREPGFEYTTLIEIGTYPVAGNPYSEPAQFESSTVLRQKLKDVYIPEARRLNAQENKVSPKVTLGQSQSGKVVSLRTVAPLSDASHVRELHEETVARVIASHNTGLQAYMDLSKNRASSAEHKLTLIQDERTRSQRLQADQRALENAKRALETFTTSTQLERVRLENEIRSQKRAIEEGKYQIQTLNEQAKLLDNERLLREQQLNQNEQAVEHLKRAQERAASDGVDATALLMMNVQIEQAIQRSDKFRESLEILLPEREASLRNDKKGLEQRLVAMNDKLEELNLSMQTFDSDYRRKLTSFENDIESAQTNLNAAQAALDADIGIASQEVAAEYLNLGLISPTHADAYGVRSQSPVGISNLVLLVLGSLISIFFGIFVELARQLYISSS